jgi:hypothetical protein
VKTGSFSRRAQLHEVSYVLKFGSVIPELLARKHKYSVNRTDVFSEVKLKLTERNFYFAYFS